jgi:hypothetical protein
MPPSRPAGAIFFLSASSVIHLTTDSLRPGFCVHECLYICNSLPEGNRSIPLLPNSLYASGLLFHIDKHSLIILSNEKKTPSILIQAIGANVCLLIFYIQYYHNINYSSWRRMMIFNMSRN